MAEIIITPLVESWRIANLTNSADVYLADVPGLHFAGSLPITIGGVPQWFDALTTTTPDILGASDTFRNATTRVPPLVGTEGYKHTHEGLYDTVLAEVSFPDATTWHSHFGMDILTAGAFSDADALHTHDSFATTSEVNTSIGNAIGGLDFSDYVRVDGNINQLSDINSEGADIESAVLLAHAQDHTLLEHLDDSPVTIENLTKLMDGSNADCCHTHGVGIDDFDHNDLNNLNVGDYLHLTAAEYDNFDTNFGTLTDGSNADALHTHVGTGGGGGGTFEGEHNELDGLQGGDPSNDEFYHLSLDQMNRLLSSAQISKLHDHYNKEILDLFDEDSSGLLWNGSPVLQSITVLDEGDVICANVHTINFKGADVQVKDCVDGVVNVYVPPPQYVAHFNSNDGDVAGDCRLSDKSTTSRFVAGPTGEGNPYNIGGWSDGDTVNTVRTTGAVHVYTTTNVCSFKDDSTTTIEVNIYDADDSTPLATHTLGPITGAVGAVIQGITIIVASWATNEDQYQGTVSVLFNIDTILGNISGRYSVEIIHHDAGDGDFTYTQGPLFYDNESNAQTIGNATIAENTPVIVRKSGVYYYDTGSTFTVNIDDLDWLNSDSYPTTLVSIVGSEYGLPTLSLGSGDLTGWTSKYNIMNVTYNKADWTINQSNYYTVRTTGNIVAQVQDWSAGASDNSPNAGMAVDTYNDNSTRIVEDFRGETNRLESDLSTSWDSTQDLTAYDGNNGLQVGEGTKLFYPKNIDYGTYEPSSGAQPDYSGESGDKVYYRAFWHSGTSHGNGIFVITGVTETNLTNDDVIIEISFDGTNWYNCNENWVTAPPLSDGQGCRVESGTYNMTSNDSLKFTLAGATTDNTTGLGATYWGIFVKITMPDTSSVEMGSIQISDWT